MWRILTTPRWHPCGQIYHKRCRISLMSCCIDLNYFDNHEKIILWSLESWKCVLVTRLGDTHRVCSWRLAPSTFMRMYTITLDVHVKFGYFNSRSKPIYYQPSSFFFGEKSRFTCVEPKWGRGTRKMGGSVILLYYKLWAKGYGVCSKVMRIGRWWL